MNSVGPILLAIESSCDETAVALIEGTGPLRASLVASQARLHARYGGVVPEVASRNHLQDLPALVQHALAEAGLTVADLGAVAATSGPGLGPALLVGLSYAKGLALGRRLPFLAINHLEGHLLSPFLGESTIPRHLGLIVSGGHTLLVAVPAPGVVWILGKTRDDAAGEAFDKAAKLLGLPYPGGAELDALAEEGDPQAFVFPQGLRHSGDLDFSFSGLKTALRYLIEKQPVSSPGHLRDLCASFRHAVVEVLTAKLLAAQVQTRAQVVAVSGGVACNRRLRQALTETSARAGFHLRLVEPAWATDNAAMIAFAAAHRWQRGEKTEGDADIRPTCDWPVVPLEKTAVDLSTLG